MIYLDTSVALAYLFAEDRCPPSAFWEEDLASSRLLEYEIWNRVHARGLASTHSESVRALLGRVGLVEMVPTVLARALEPFPAPPRTLDALHIASAVYLRAQGEAVTVASYDTRFVAVARDLGFTIAEI
ncbi:MAG TPA: PIN domain-containing protein [Thermoanaerobaculia bacterium]|nr:PIN domain-containing protein [Thermoanaerobaculia bacterium]